jgi:hypothetical protein
VAHVLHRRQIDTEHLEEFVAHRLVGSVGSLLGLGGVGHFTWLSRKFICWEIPRRTRSSASCGGPGLPRLAKGKERLSAPLSTQRPGDLRFAFLAAAIPQPGQCLRSAFTRPLCAAPSSSLWSGEPRPCSARLSLPESPARADAESKKHQPQRKFILPSLTLVGITLAHGQKITTTPVCFRAGDHGSALEAPTGGLE